MLVHGNMRGKTLLADCNGSTATVKLYCLSSCIIQSLQTGRLLFRRSLVKLEKVKERKNDENMNE